MSAKRGVGWFLALALVLLSSGLARAKIYAFSLLELIEQSNVMVSGKVLEVGENSALVEVGRTLKGRVAAKVIEVSPIWLEHCVGRSKNFTVGEEVVLLLKRSDDGSLTVVAAGQGKVAVDTKARDSELEAMARLIEIAALEGEDTQNRAMLSEATSPNTRLRSESHRYIATKIAHSSLRQNYKDSLIVLLKHQADDVRIAALRGLRFVKAEEAIPLMIEAARSEGLQVLSSASLALGQYDTEESVAARIALTRHPNPKIRARACIDLDRSRRLEAKEAIKKLFDDEDPGVRAMAPRGLVYWIRRGEASVTGRLIAMLRDPAEEVRVAGVHYLGETASPAAARSLLALLRHEGLNEPVAAQAVKSLNMLQKRNRPAGALIVKDLPLFIDILEHDRWNASFSVVGILGKAGTPEAAAALERAAKGHPREDVRWYAKRALADIRFKEFIRMEEPPRTGQ